MRMHILVRRPLVTLTLAALAWMIQGRAASPVDDNAASVARTDAVQRVRQPFAGMRNEAAMVLVGFALIGLAAAVRRAA